MRPLLRCPTGNSGERPCAFIITQDGAPLDFPEIVAFLSTRQIAKFMYPERIEIVDVFPLASVGKVDPPGLFRPGGSGNA